MSTARRLRGQRGAARRTWIAPVDASARRHEGPRSTRDLLGLTTWRDPLGLLLTALALPVWLIHDVLVYLFDRAFRPRFPRGNELNWRHPAAYVLLPFFVLAFIAARIVFNPLTQRYINRRRERLRRPSP